MAELKLFDIPGAFNSGYDRGRQMRQANTLNQLAAQAYGAPVEQQDALVRQAIASDAASGLQLGQALDQDEGRRTRSLVNMARMLTNAPDQARPQLYQRMLPSLQRFGVEAPPQYDDTVAQTARAIVQAYGLADGSTPTEVRAFQAMTQGLTPDEQERARRIHLGLEGRASNAGYGFREVEGADGRKRLARNNPRTGVVEIYDETTGNFVPMGGAIPGPTLQAEDGSALATTRFTDANGQPINFGNDLPPEFREAVLSQPQQFAALPDNASATLPTVDRSPAQFRSGNPSLGVSRRPEDEAAAKRAAETAVDLAALPQRQAIETQAAIERKAAESQVTQQADRQKQQAERNNAFAQYQAAIQGLRRSLPNTTTGPIIGRLPALTAEAQTAEGAVAALAPVLKQLFRAAGEGTFTDRDQQLLLDMVPTRTDLPAAREAKLQNIDNIVRAKLGQGGIYGAAPSDGPAAPQASNRVLRYNPATGDFE